MRTARALTVSPSMLCAGGCTWSQGVYLVPGGVPGSGGCTWFWGVYLVPGVGGVPGPGGPGGVPGPGRCTWQVLGGVPGWGIPRGVYLVWGVHLVPGGVPGLGGVPGQGVYLVWGDVPGQGVYLDGPGGCTWSGTPPCGQNHRCL